VILAILSILAVSIILVNGLIFYIYFTSSRMRKNYVYNFKLSTSAADLLIGAVYIPMLITFILKDISVRDTRLAGSISRKSY